MLKRRALFSAAAAVGSVAASFVTGCKAKAVVPKLDFDYEPRGTHGRLKRLPNLDVESRDGVEQTKIEGVFGPCGACGGARGGAGRLAGKISALSGSR